MATVFLVSRAVVCDHGFLGGSCCPLKSLHVQGLLATEQGEGEVLKGCHRRHPALHGEDFAHSHPSGLQLQQYLLWGVCRGESGGGWKVGEPRAPPISTVFSGPQLDLWRLGPGLLQSVREEEGGRLG